MILTVAEFRQFVDSDDSDAVLEMKLKAIEHAIRKYTNNKFHVKNASLIADVPAGIFMSEALIPFEAGDTIEIVGSDKNDGLYTVKEVTDDTTFTVNEKTRDEIDVCVVKVEYPPDVKMGVVNMMTWEKENRTKAGIQSESISRHTVNYINLDQWNATMGYPASLVQFLKPHMKARFGQGLGV